MRKDVAQSLETWVQKGGVKKKKSPVDSARIWARSASFSPPWWWIWKLLSGAPLWNREGTIGEAPASPRVPAASRRGKHKSQQISAKDLTQLLLLLSWEYCFTHSWLTDRQISTIWAEIVYYYFPLCSLLSVLPVHFFSIFFGSKQLISCLHRTQAHIKHRSLCKPTLSAV